MSKTIRIERDEDAENPRDNENLWHIAGWHRRYNIGDEQPSSSADEHLKDLPKKSLVVPLYMYDHGSITIATTPFSCEWDSGQVGHCWVTPKDIIENFGEDTPETRTQAQEMLQAEVKAYDLYLKGDCWQFSIEREDGELVSSCSGFLGDDVIDNGMIENIEVEDFDLFIEAARAAGLTVNDEKLTEWKARVAAQEMKERTPPGMPTKPGRRV